MSDKPASVWDPGLQPERTALSWRRTTVSLAIGSIIALRILPELLGTFGVFPGLIGIFGAMAMGLASEKRSKAMRAALQRGVQSGEHPRIGGGILLVLVAGGVLVIGILGAAVLLSLLLG